MQIDANHGNGKAISRPQEATITLCTALQLFGNYFTRALCEAFALELRHA
jgi:hypothetical protein